MLLNLEDLISTYSPAKQLFHEIVSIGSPNSRIDRWPAAHQAPGSAAVEYWSSGELCPELPRSLVGALHATIGERFKPDINALRVRIRMAPSRDLAGYFSANATLLYYPPPDSPGLVESMRDMAASLLAGLQASSGKGRGTADEAHSFPVTTAIDPQTLMALPVARFLGTSISNELLAQIPGRASLEFKSRFREAPLQPLDAKTFDVLGKFLSIKSGGRSRSTEIKGFRQDTRGEFNETKVTYEEDLRDSISRSVAEPWRNLLMSVTRTAVYCGKAKPLVTHKLESFEFVS